MDDTAGKAVARELAKELGLDNNLDVVRNDIDLFGAAHKRLAVQDRIGFVPISIWQPNWNLVSRLKDIVGDAGQTRHLEGKKMALLGSKYTTSIFNPHLAQMILSAYCPTNAKIYDAFAGGGTRGFIAASMGHRYYGVEIRPDEVERIKAKMIELDMGFDLQVGDAQWHDPGDDFDFSYSCPPYYDLEVYSALPGDMSNVQSYDEFLGMLKNSLDRTYACLAPGALCIWVVGNFRDKHGALRHFNGDTVRLAQEAGFILHDELIFWGAAGIAAQRAGQFVANRKSVRVHEYLLVFKKPSVSF